MVNKFTFRLGHNPEYDAPCVEKVPTQMTGPRVFVALEAQLIKKMSEQGATTDKSQRP